VDTGVAPETTAPAPTGATSETPAIADAGDAGCESGA